MTSLDPSHAPWLGRSTDRSHGEAVHTSAPPPPSRQHLADADDESIDEDEHSYHDRKRAQQRSARARGRVPIPPLPDLRYEQGYLLSIMPFLHPEESRPPPTTKKGKEREREAEVIEETSLVKDAQQDIFHRPLRVEWGSLAYVTLRDQVFSPLVQGLLWGTIGMGATAFMIWRQLQPKASRGARLLHANLVGWSAALLGAQPID